jgi:hypothetical protein
MKLFTAVPLSLILLTAAAVYAEDVTVCGQTVSQGVLVGDLDCSAAGCAVTIADGGSLDLAGFTITVSQYCGVSCVEDCSVEGSGGSIVGSPAIYGIHSTNKYAEIRVSNVEIAVVPPGPFAAPPIMTNYGIYSDGSVIADNCTFSSCGYAVWSKRSMEVRNSNFHGNGTALNSRKDVLVENSTISGGNQGAAADRRLRATGVTIEGNGYHGLIAKKVRASNSTVAGNGGDVDCMASAYACADIVSAGQPVLDGVACDTSADLDRDLNPTQKTWGACSLD